MFEWSYSPEFVRVRDAIRTAIDDASRADAADTSRVGGRYPSLRGDMPTRANDRARDTLSRG